MTSNKVEQETDLFTLHEETWKVRCMAPRHYTMEAGHSDDSPVWRVAPLKLPCGHRGTIYYVCEGWIKANPYLHCPACGQTGFLFRLCYLVLGPA